MFKPALTAGKGLRRARIEYHREVDAFGVGSVSKAFSPTCGTHTRRTTWVDSPWFSLGTSAAAPDLLKSTPGRKRVSAGHGVPA